MKVGEFLLNKDKYKVDKTYQRPDDCWSAKDKKCFIDTILRGEPIPLFFLNYITNEDVYYIVNEIYNNRIVIRIMKYFEIVD